MISAKVLATGTISFVLTFGAITAFGQNTSANAGIPKNDKPRFVAADIHVSAKGLNQNPRSPSTHGDIFEARYVTMADLIGFAYNTPTINVVGGPNWLEMEALLARPSFPKTFEVATFKPTASGGNIRSRVQTQPGGRIMIEGYGLNFLLMRAFVPTRSGELVGVPSWANDARFDLVAQARLDPSLPALDSAAVAPMMLALLKQRFGLTFHTEQRGLEAYNLVAAKPRMKKADPSARTWCKTPAQVPGSGPPPQGAQTMICQNVTMSQFAELLLGKTSELRTPVVDSTGLQGGWDFRLTFVPDIAAVRAAAANASATNPTAGIPDIVSSSIFEAVEKQLGLKLERVKRPAAVTVIDHLDRTPTEN